MSALEPSAFERGVLPHVDAMYDLAQRLTGSRADAEDLVQESLVRALGAFADLDGGSCTRAWLFTILRNAAHNRWRDAARHPASPLGPDDVAAEPEVEPPDWQRLTSQDLEAILPRLPEPAREAVVLRDLYGLTYKEVAVVVGCPVGTVMSRLHRGRAELRRLALARVGPATRSAG
jgi:RNA polymerase sigma-70 factor, ECF subfamily